MALYPLEEDKKKKVYALLMPAHKYNTYKLFRHLFIFFSIYIFFFKKTKIKPLRKSPFSFISVLS